MTDEVCNTFIRPALQPTTAKLTSFAGTARHEGAFAALPESRVFALPLVTSSTGREPTANGPASQATVRANTVCPAPGNSEFRHRVLLALLLATGEGGLMHVPVRRVPPLPLPGPNVRHERRAKGREAAFGLSARWRG